MVKAKKLETFYDKYFTTIVYEYRGHKYEVTYPNGWQVCCTPAWIQHRDEQEKIDKMLDYPVQISTDGVYTTPKADSKPFTEQLDEIWNMLGW